MRANIIWECMHRYRVELDNFCFNLRWGGGKKVSSAIHPPSSPSFFQMQIELERTAASGIWNYHSWYFRDFSQQERKHQNFVTKLINLNNYSRTLHDMFAYNTHLIWRKEVEVVGRVGDHISLGGGVVRVCLVTEPEYIIRLSLSIC